MVRMDNVVVYILLTEQFGQTIQIYNGSYNATFRRSSRHLYRPLAAELAVDFAESLLPFAHILAEDAL